MKMLTLREGEAEHKVCGDSVGCMGEGSPLGAEAGQRGQNNISKAQPQQLN
jgi:hypothetical protein